MQKAAFLDRDGVINADHGYVSQPENFEWLPGVFEACRELARLGYAIVVVTNQSGIARGYYGEEDFLRLTDWMKARFADEGVSIAGVYYCPHHPEKALGQYKVACTCRKPQPGMILRAAEEMSIDLSQSILFGDKESDMQAAQAAGIPRRILLGKDGLNAPQTTVAGTDVSRSLATAVAKLGL